MIESDSMNVTLVDARIELFSNMSDVHIPELTQEWNHSPEALVDNNFKRIDA